MGLPPTPLHSASCSRSFQDLDSTSWLILRFWILYQLLPRPTSKHHLFNSSLFWTYLVQWFLTSQRNKVPTEFRAMAYLPRIVSDPPWVRLPSCPLHQEAQHRTSSASAEGMTQHWNTCLFSFPRRPTLLQHTRVLSWSIKCYKFHWNRLDSYVSSQAWRVLFSQDTPRWYRWGDRTLPQKGSHSSIWRPLEGHEQTAGSLGSRPTDKKIFSWPTGTL